MGKQAEYSKKTTQTKEPAKAGVSSAPSLNNVFAEMSWRVALPFMGFVLLGNWLDERFETDPALTIVGLALGVASVWLIVRRLVQKHFPQESNSKKGEA